VILYSKSAERPNSDANLHFEVSSVLMSAKGFSVPIDQLEKPIGLFAGIGNPQYFFNALTKLSPSIQTTLSFPDHTSYKRQDYDFILDQNCSSWITTQKDIIKLDPDFCIQNNVYTSLVKTGLPPILRDALKHYFK
jgi:tetraacyldisaccharide 4'-kinase